MLPTKPANTLIPDPIPSSAWYTLGADIFYLDMKIYLYLIDCYSKFPIIHELPDNSTHSLKEAIKDVISEYGFFKELVSDTDTNFTSDDFQTFCRKLDIKSKITSSYHHSSNGQVENCIKLIKRTFNKCFKN